MDLQIRICSLRENPHLFDKAKDFVLQAWGDEKSKQFYTEVLRCNIETQGFIPHFLFALTQNEEIVGCVGVALQDFVSCANLYPFLVALFVEASHRKRGIARMLIERAKLDCKKAGFENLYLCSDLCGFYEKFGFIFHTMAYDVFGFNNRIYRLELHPESHKANYPLS